MEYSVQTCRKGWIFLVEVHKVCGSFGIERMPPTLQLASGFWLRVLLSRKYERHVRSLDTEGSAYLVHLYEEDPTFPAGLNGIFHGLLTDRARGTATLFNDRYGMHRIYYHESKEAFYFAAEAKAILAVRPELKTADPRGLGEMVAF